jgi:PiT family inorganic phosphate transporter
VDLTNIKQITHADSSMRKEILRIGFVLVFMIAAMLYVGNTVEPVAHHYLLIIAAASSVGIWP